jgi:predicted permease
MRTAAERFVQDIRYAVRTWRRNPGFAAVAVILLGLGIGANSAIFGLLQAVMLGALPVAAPDRIVQITRLMREGRPGVVSYPLFEYFRDNITTVSGAFAETSARPAVVANGVEQVAELELVSGSYYSVLGLTPAAGRLLQPPDDRPGATPVAVLGYRFWLRRFGLAPTIIGKTLTIRNTAFTVVGVTPPSFQGTIRGRDPEITVALAMMKEVRGDSNEDWRRQAGMNQFDLLARLKPGATVEQTNAEVQALFGNWLQMRAAGASGKERASILRERAMARPAPDGVNPLRFEYSKPLWLLMGMGALALLLLCANLAGLLAARAAARRREISVRLAIGAGHGRLARQLLTESLVLAALGGGTGLLLAHWLRASLVAVIARGGHIALPEGGGWTVLAFTAAISVLACLLAGIAPAWQAVRAGSHPAWKEARAVRSGHWGRGLVISQIAVSMLLLVGAALFIGTLWKLHSVDKGFRTGQVMTFRFRANQRYPAGRGLEVQAALLERLSALPGVRTASAVHVLPIVDGLWTRSVKVEGYNFGPGEDESVAFNAVAPKYFETLGTPLLAGRDFDTRDSAAARKVAIVNERFARYFFGARSPLGLRVAFANDTYEIVGVAGDAKYQSLRADVPKTVYVASLQLSDRQPTNYTYLARTMSGDAGPARAVEALALDVDPFLRVRVVQPYDEIVNHLLDKERLLARLAGFFGLLAVSLAGLGVFGLLAIQVSRRTSEIGVRMALGATRGDVLRLVLREVALMLGCGLALGGLAALSLTHLATRIVFGMTPRDPAVFAAAAAVLTLSALAAAWIPARRAANVDPTVSLRYE